MLIVIPSDVHFKSCTSMVCMGAKIATKDQNLREMNTLYMILNLGFHF